MIIAHPCLNENEWPRRDAILINYANKEFFGDDLHFLAENWSFFSGVSQQFFDAAISVILPTCEQHNLQYLPN